MPNTKMAMRSHASEVVNTSKRHSRAQGKPQMASSVKNDEKEKAKAAIAQLLKEILKRKGMSQLDFALRLKRNPSLISQWLNGKHNFTLDSLSDACEVLGLSLSEFFHPKEEENPAPVRQTMYVIATRAGSKFNKNATYSGGVDSRRIKPLMKKRPFDFHSSVYDLVNDGDNK